MKNSIQDDNFEVKYDNLAALNESLKREIDHKEKIISDLTSSYNEVHGELTEIRTEKENLQNEFDRLEDNFASLELKKIALKNAVNSLTEAI